MWLGPTTDCVRCTSNLRSGWDSLWICTRWSWDFFGAAIFFLGNALHQNALVHPWLLYVLIYVPARCLEWSIMAALLGAKGNEAYRIGDGATQRWILEGMGVSNLADFPMNLLYAASGGLLPVGGFLC